MPNESGHLSSIPDQPPSKSAVETIDSIGGVKRAISPTWQTPVHAGGEFTEDLIIITDDRVQYYSRERGEGWIIKRDETYEDDEEFEYVMDNVHDYAYDYSEERIEKKVREDP